MEKNHYIPMIPGNIKDADDTRTDVLSALGIELSPMSNERYNDGYNDPPIAALKINGKQYSLAGLLKKIGEGLKPALDYLDMIAPTEASTTASMAHIPGTASEYFILSGVLYQATSPIAQGGTIVTSGSGANCKEAPLGQAVSELKSAIGIFPEMYGAIGDGVTDDTNPLAYAFIDACNSGVPVLLSAGKTYLTTNYVHITKRINVYGNGATIKGIGTDQNEVILIESEEGQFPTVHGKGLIENLTIDANGRNIGLNVFKAQGYELQNLDICGFSQIGALIRNNFEIFAHNIRIAGTTSATTVGMQVQANDSRFVNIVTKNVGTGIQNIGQNNFYDHVHAWNTDSNIIPTSVMIENQADLHLTESYVDDCAIGIKQASPLPVYIDGLIVLRDTTYMSSAFTPILFGVTSAANAVKIKAYGIEYPNTSLSYDLFDVDISDVNIFDWSGNNDLSIQNMGRVPALMDVYELNSAVGDLRSAIETIERWAWPENNNITLLNQIVAEGRGPIAAPVGTALYVDKDDAQIAMNVLEHDYHTPANSAIPHTCTIGMRDCFENRQFDAAEALIKVVDGLAAGSHFYLTLNHGAYYGGTEQDGTYGGTLGAGQAIPAGGYLRHTTMGLYQSGEYNVSQITDGKWIAYDTNFNQIGAEIATDSGDTTGTNFGISTASTYNGNSEHVNFTTRNHYGNNRIDQSAWLQYANAEGTGWWVQKNEWDFPPESVATIKGFLTGIDPVMKAAMVKVKIRTALPTCDGGGYKDIETYVFPLSMTEVGLGANNNQYETSWGLNNTLKTTALSFYQNATGANRIKTLDEVARHWRIRGPYPSQADDARFVDTSGNLNHGVASSAIGFVAACAVGNPGIQSA